ncbi:MAG: hypothetical protein HY319_04175 [Armatimonadetes bacterium]|nr:hypothetical protein [Armatimonadota bacterium]
MKVFCADGVPRRASRGLTIAEVVISIGLLALLLSSVLVLLNQMVASTARNADLTVGSLFAESLLETCIREARTTPFPTPAFDPVVASMGGGAEGIYTHDSAQQTTFLHKLTATPLGPTGLVTETWYVEVEVNWWASDTSQAGQSRAGLGRLSTTQGRLVYVSRDS